MAHEELSKTCDDESDFLELCDTSEFADDESLVQEIAASRAADNLSESSSAATNSGRHATLCTSVIYQAARNSSDESEEDSTGVSSRRVRMRNNDRERNKDGKPHEADSSIHAEEIEDAALKVDGAIDGTESISGLPFPKNQVPPRRHMTMQKNSNRERLGQATAIHINRNFRGSVQALPGTRLAWDSGTLNVYNPLAHVGGMRPFSGLLPRFRSPFPGAAGNLQGLPIFTVPHLRPVHPMQSIQAARFLQERLLRTSFGALQGPSLPSVSQAVLRRNQARSRPYFLEKSNQSRPPNF